MGLDGRARPSDCANTEGVLRIVMSVPSPKAEPLKLWLAQVGKERIEETESPELSFERAKAVYKAKEYYDFTLNQEVRLSSIFVKAHYQLVKVNLKEVLFIEGLDDYIRIHLADNKSILTLMSLKAITEKLPAHEFIRIHRSYIVNAQLITRITPYEKDSHLALLTTGTQLPVSKAGYTKLKEVLGI